MNNIMIKTALVLAIVSINVGLWKGSVLADTPMQKVLDDFIVNEETYRPGMHTQSQPDISCDDAGNFVVAWADERNGNWDIYAQRYRNDGTPQDDAFKVNDDTGNSVQWFPAICVDADGDFTIAWEDNRSGKPEIYARRYDRNGVAQGDSFKVNNYAAYRESTPDISCDRDGNFVVVWANNNDIDEGGGIGIYARRYNNKGEALGKSVEISDVPGFSFSSPSVSMNDKGNFIVAWYYGTMFFNGYRFESGIYARRYDSNGIPLSDKFMVSHRDEFLPYSVAVSYDNLGNETIVYVDAEDTKMYVYAQRNGITLKVSEEPVGGKHFGVYTQSSSDISSSSDGSFVITWCKGHQVGISRADTPIYDFDIYAQRYDSKGQQQGKNFQVNDKQGSVYYVSRHPSSGLSRSSPICSDASGNFVIAWVDKRNEWADYGDSADIYIQRYNSGGEPQGSNFKVDGDIVAADQYEPVVASDPKGNFVIVWVDRGIHVKLYESDGKMRKYFEVKDDLGNSVKGEEPDVSSDKNGNFVIVWTDFRASTSEIYAQRYDNNGVPLGGNFKVSEEGSFNVHPAICHQPDGGFVIAWSSYNAIYARRYDNIGQPRGNIIINMPILQARVTPDIASDANGNFVITWLRGDLFFVETETFDICAQRYNTEGERIGHEFIVNNDRTDYRCFPSVAFDIRGNFVITWLEGGESPYHLGEPTADLTDLSKPSESPGDIYAKFYDNNGVARSKNFKVNDSEKVTSHPPIISFNFGEIYSDSQKLEH